MDTQTVIPIPDAPLVRGDKITEVWFRFLLQLFNRTGGTPGRDLTKIIRDISDLQADADGQNYGAAIASLQAALSDVPADVAVQVLRDEPPPDVYAHGSQGGADLHAAASQTVAGFMSAADKMKLDTLPSIVMSPIALTADVVAQNSTTDVNIFSTVLGANSLAVGSTFLSSFTILASAAGSGGTLSIWVKVGAVKVLTSTFTVPLSGLSNQPIVSVFRFTVRTIGSAGTFQVSGNNNGNSTLFTNGIVINTAAGSINTTTANTLSIGMNWSTANVANIAAAKTGLMNQEK